MNATAVKKVAAKKSAIKKAPASKVAAKKAPVSAPVSKPVKAPVKAQPSVTKIEKVKIKLVRDSFTMPADDWALIAQLKERALAFKRPAKKSELLRAGLQTLAALPDAKLKAALESLQALKPGRPKADKGEKK